MNTTYQGKKYEVLDLDDAVTEALEQKAKGVLKAVVYAEGGYIVVDAVFREEEQQDEEENL